MFVIKKIKSQDKKKLVKLACFLRKILEKRLIRRRTRYLVNLGMDFMWPEFSGSSRVQNASKAVYGANCGRTRSPVGLENLFSDVTSAAPYIDDGSRKQVYQNLT